MDDNTINSVQEPVLQLQNIRKSFDDTEILKGVSLSAAEGEVVSIIGSSGSGKSTLLRCINFLEIADAGQISVAGNVVSLASKDKSSLPSKYARQIERIRSRASMVFQGFNLWSHRTILENVIEAPIYVQGRARKDCIAEGEALLRKVGIYAKKNSYPSELSGGQQQRVAIARALAMRPALILLDEPTSALDPELVSEVLQVIKNLAEAKTTMIIVTHELSFAKEVSSKVVFLEKGVVAEEGKPAELFGNPKSDRLRQFLKSSQR